VKPFFIQAKGVLAMAGGLEIPQEKPFEPRLQDLLQEAELL
jgi:hypothetical protein